ncbi:hypothetical protein BDB01DRAFT_264119 [Pilobolus umbonatus]|nr:hypothetical protein BDB01DRAFT_264119 [Pilobolus umbonatus]
MLKHYSDTGPLLLQNSVIGHSVIGSMSDKTEFHIPDTIKLLDISIDKDAVAFVTEDDKLKVFTCIEMDYFKESDTIDLTSTGIPLTDNYAMFLSVSSRGEYVVISYFDMDTYGNAKAAHTNKCVVFKQGAVYFQTKCNGRAVFIKKDRLALIDLDKIKILNSQFQQEYFLDLYPLIKNCEMVVGPINEDIKWRHLCKQVTYHDDREASLLVNLSRHIRSDVLVTVNQATFAFIWLISDGTLLSSFKIMPDEEILAIAKNTQSIATYDKHNSVVRIYDAKNGLVVNHLKISPKVTEDIEFTVSYLRFCDNGRYLLIVGLEKSIREKDIIQAITFEFWHIVAEKLIYRNRSSQDMERVESNTEWTNMILPFVIADAPVDDASLPKWHAIHSVRESPESDAHKIIKKEFSLNESLNERLIEARGWKHNSPNIVFYGFQSEIVEALDKQDGFVCFSRAIETANGPIHILVRFGAHTVQMWKVDQGSDPGDLDKHELMYIRAYKTLQPNSSYTFRDDFTPYPDENGCTDVKVMMNNDGRMRIPVYKKSVDKPNDMLDFTCVMEEIILPIEPEEFSFHTFESVCSALYYLYRLEDQGLVKENSKAYRTLRKNHMLLYQKTLRLAQAGLRSILKTECNYFATYSGSQTMAKLACFSDGWDILQMVMTDDDLPLVIFSHKKGERLWENVLTVLLEHTQYDLFHYLFNRVIRDAEQSSLGTTSVLLDVLLYLQDQGNRGKVKVKEKWNHL